MQGSVIPAKAGIHNLLIFQDSRVRGNDGSTNTIFLKFMWLVRITDPEVRKAKKNYHESTESSQGQRRED